MTDRGFEDFGVVAKDRIDSMMLQDWVTLLLASLVVAFAVFAETIFRHMHDFGA